MSRVSLLIKCLRRGCKPVKIKLKVINKVCFKDIELFRNSTSFVGAGKGANDSNNTKRENLLVELSNMTHCHPYMSDDHWKSLKYTFDDVLLQLFQSHCKTTESFAQVSVKKAAGRANNFDFSFEYLTNDGTSVVIPKVEFKNERGGSMSRLPQVLSLQIKQSSRSIIKGERYDSFFYDNYLDRVLSTFPADVIFQKPNKEIYEKLIGNTKYDVLPMFTQMYDEELKAITKNSIVDDSINEYLKRVTSDMIDYDYIEDKLESALASKQFILWDGNKFNLDIISDECFKLKREFKLKQDRSGKKSHTIVLMCENGEFAYHFLLRWRNHKGVLNPAWQISCVPNLVDK